MVRTLKKPEERKKEILEAAKELFHTLGYNQTPVNAIIKKAGIAKGTFYYYFRSKNEVLSCIAYDTVKEMVKEAQKIVSIKEINALEKLKKLLRGQSESFDTGYKIVDHLHQPENRELHESLNIEIIKKFGPIIAKVIEQGILEGHFSVERPLETIQLILAGSQFLLTTNLFDWSESQEHSITLAMQSMIERSLGAKKGSFSFLREPYKISSYQKTKKNKTKRED
ncbi:MAG: TetR/AcrR family transcriptional regulator [Candidatus Hermodarchaeota archaeon]